MVVRDLDRAPVMRHASQVDIVEYGLQLFPHLRESTTAGTIRTMRSLGLLASSQPLASPVDICATLFPTVDISTLEILYLVPCRDRPPVTWMERDILRTLMPHLSIGQMATLSLFSSQGGTAQITGRLRANLLHVDRPVKKVDEVVDEIATRTATPAPDKPDGTTTAAPSTEGPTTTPGPGTKTPTDPSPGTTVYSVSAEGHDRALRQPASELARFAGMVSERQDDLDDKLSRVTDTMTILQKQLGQVTFAPQTPIRILSRDDPATPSTDWQANSRGPDFSITPGDTRLD